MQAKRHQYPSVQPIQHHQSTVDEPGVDENDDSMECQIQEERW